MFDETLSAGHVAVSRSARRSRARLWLRVLVASTLLSAAAAAFVPAASASERNPTSNQRQAEALLRRVVGSIGGTSALAELERLEITASGASWIGYEADQPGELLETSTYTRSYTFDLDDEQLRVDSTRQPLFEAFQFQPPQSFTRVLDGEVGGITDGAGFLIPAGSLPSESVTALRRQQQLFNPHLLLREALEQPGLVGYGGRVTLNGRHHRILTIDDDVAEIRLFIDQRTDHISKLETTENHPLVRDTEIEVTYDDWQRQSQHHDRPGRGHNRGHRRGALWFPGQVELFAGGDLVWQETRTGVTLEPVLPVDHFDLPQGTDPSAVNTEASAFGDQSHHLVEGFFALGFFYGPRAGFAPPAELAPGVTLFASGANTLAIEHADGLVVLEAPNTPAHGSDIINALTELAPDKPISHLVQSHHHVDHASAVRSFAATGATIVVGDGTADFWGGVLNAESTVRPDALAASGVIGAVEEIDVGDNLVIADDDITVTVHHLATRPHAEDMVITTIETDGQVFVYNADLYNAGINFALVIGGPQALFAELRTLGIIDETCASALPMTIVPGHGFPQTLQASLAELESMGIDVGCPTP